MFRIAIAMGVLLAWGGSVGAQDYYYGRAGNYGGGYHHASTYEEGVQRGYADIVRSAGYANLMNSLAAKNYEDARKKEIENRMEATQTYFQMRSYNQSAREAEAGPRPSQEDVIRYSRSRAPNRLTNNQLDPVTGRIQWPLILAAAECNDARNQLDKLYVERSIRGYLTVDEYSKVRDLTDGLSAHLKENIAKYPPNDYVSAKKFVESLAYESTLQAG